MQRTRVKICGIRDVETALVAAEAGADAIGLVFVSGSPRYVAPDQAEQIVRALPAFVQPVALFADATAEEIRSTAMLLGIHTVQLHGGETPQFAASLAPLRVIKAMAFDARQASEALRPWRTCCDNLAGILFDAPPPQPDGLRGGSGRTFDWQALANLIHGGMLAGLPPLILAGGLDADNVGSAIRSVRPYAVDVSSGVESSRGIKDAQRIRQFMRAVLEADTQRRQGETV
mgnify:FL=1